MSDEDLLTQEIEDLLTEHHETGPWKYLFWFIWMWF